MDSTGNPSSGNDSPQSFGWLYTLAVWAGTVFMVLLTVWILWTLFVHTASGTSRGLSVELSKATQTAVYEAMPSPTPGEGVVELPAACKGCHMIAGTSAAGTVGPDLTHIGTMASERMADPDYAGEATTVEEYIRESILEPNVYLVLDKPTYAANGQSIMPAAIGAGLSPAELDQLVAYLASLE